ncbi:MAG TPA: type IV toxin-antitoxin system AbiEi family antitoxin domain-containing protein [Microbacterium sp.]|nr:type IV toxin-antitoxin system AbiEi family antitoxin domain-containing protein [Microbacterium sp.]
MASPLPLLTPDDLAASGLSARRIGMQVGSGELVRVRPGVYTAGAPWRQAKPEQRVVSRAHALHRISASAPVFSHETAAAIHGIGLYHPDPSRVHVIVADARPGAASGVIRHRGELADEDVIQIRGLRCTSLARTVADVARTGTLEQAVTVADAALRALCVPERARYDVDAAAQFRARALQIARRSAHGLTRATRVLAFADGRAERPGESLSRIRLHTLGFRRILLQVPVPGPRGWDYYVDFGLEDCAKWGEFDGAMKYVDGRLTDGRTTAEIFDREKQREDWIRGTTGRGLVRWGWPHLDSAAQLGRRLAAFGIHPPA